LERGYARIKRTWKKGDVIDLLLSMPVRRVVANASVKADAGRIALQRGPIVFCAEGIDNGGKALNLALSDRAAFRAEFRPALLNGVVVLRGKARAGNSSEGGKISSPKERDFLAIPYYAWANRGAGEMEVWFPRIRD
jgi:DUF1680 family protein